MMSRKIRILIAGLAVVLSTSALAVKPIITTFNAGELSPLMRMRTDFQKYDNGCSALQNMIPLSQGPVMRRPGTYYVAETETMTERSRLIPFEFSKTDTYILEFGDEYMRVYRDHGQVQDPDGTEDMTDVGGEDLSSYVVAQWKLNDDAANTTVADAIGSHTGASSTNTSNLSTTGRINDCFDMDGQYYVTVSDDDDFTFDDSADEAFSIAAWVYVTNYSDYQTILSKWDHDTPAREWIFRINSNEYLSLRLWDETEYDFAQREYWSHISDGWHFVVATYNGQANGGDTHEGIELYLDNELTNSYGVSTSGYTRMRNLDTDVLIGACTAGGSEAYFWQDKLDNIVVFNIELTPTQVSGLFNGTSVYELTTTYTENEVDDLQYVQLADTMYIVHPSHEPRKLTRSGHTNWSIADVNYIDGPFLPENTDTDITVTPSAATGTITLDSNSDIFEAGHVGALWQIRHPRTDATLSGSFTSATSSSAIDCEGDYQLITHGTWTGTVDIERSLDGSTWEIVSGGHINSVNDDNCNYSGNEPDAGYQYRITMTSYTSGTCTYDFIVYDHMHTGVVRIASYVDPNEVTATVHTELGGTSETYYWSEGYWSPKNGYPETIEFHEFRLWYGGNNAYPQTIWASKTDDFELMKEGTDDDDALIYTLPGQNPIQWMLSHTYLMIGTLGGAGRLGDPDEGMSPNTQPIYRHQSTDGSAYEQAVLAGEAILYVERGGRKIREFVYSFEQDKFVSPDMTVLAEHITGDGITEIALQNRPETTLWCVREDGELLSMTYNRGHEVVAWSLHDLDGDVESVAVIPGALEDEVWLIVERTIDSATKRYIEYMKPYDWGSDDNDAYFVDCGLTWDGGDAVNISGATQANPCVITVSTWPTDGDGDNLADGDQIKILSVAGMTELNGNIYTIDDASVSNKTFSLDNSAGTTNINSTAYTAYTSGGTVQRFENTFSGFDHLEGETIDILGDGSVQTSQTVSSGGFSISNWVNKLHAGLEYTSIVETMPIVFDSESGTTAASQNRIDDVSINFYKSLGTEYGIEGDVHDCFKETSLVSGWKKLTFHHGYFDDEATIYIKQDKPQPLTIRAIIPNVTITER